MSTGPARWLIPPFAVCTRRRQGRRICGFNLPDAFINWNTVRYYFHQWTLDGTFVRINDALRERARGNVGRHPQPSAGIIDSQSKDHEHHDLCSEAMVSLASTATLLRPLGPHVMTATHYHISSAAA